MHSSRGGCSRAGLFALFVAKALALCACGSPTQCPAGSDAAALVDAAATAGLDASAGLDARAPDIGPGLDAETPPDASEPDSGPPPRELTTYNPLGTTPVGNHVIVPNFDLMSFGWFVFNSNMSTDGLLVYRKVLPRSPAGLPTLVVQGSSPQQALVAGFVRGGRGPMHAEVWIGRRVVDGEHADGLSVSIVGFAPTLDVGDTSFELVPDPASLQAYDGIMWRKYTASISDEVLAYATFTIVESKGIQFFVTGPVLEAEVARSRLGGAHRAPTALQSQAFHVLMERARLPPPPPGSIRQRLQARAVEQIAPLAH
jgi:hypothetical protein